MQSASPFVKQFEELIGEIIKTIENNFRKEINALEERANKKLKHIETRIAQLEATSAR